MHWNFAISIIVKQIALALAPSTESQNNQFFLPTVIGRIAFSLRLLLRLHLPSSRYVISESFRFRMYITAWSRRLPLTGVCASSHDKKASMTGFSSLRRRFFLCSGRSSFRLFSLEAPNSFAFRYEISACRFEMI